MLCLSCIVYLSSEVVILAVYRIIWICLVSTPLSVDLVVCRRVFILVIVDGRHRRVS